MASEEQKIIKERETAAKIGVGLGASSIILAKKIDDSIKAKQAAKLGNPSTIRMQYQSLLNTKGIIGSFIYGSNFLIDNNKFTVRPANTETYLSKYYSDLKDLESNSIIFSVQDNMGKRKKYGLLLHSPPESVNFNFDPNTIVERGRGFPVANFMGGSILKSSFDGKTRMWYLNLTGTTNMYRGFTHSYRNFMEFIIFFMQNGRTIYGSENIINHPFVTYDTCYGISNSLYKAGFTSELIGKPRYSRFVTVKIGILEFIGKFTRMSWKQDGPYNFSYSFEMEFVDYDIYKAEEMNLLSNSSLYDDRLTPPGFGQPPDLYLIPKFKYDSIVRDFFLRINSESLKKTFGAAKTNALVPARVGDFGESASAGSRAGSVKTYDDISKELVDKNKKYTQTLAAQMSATGVSSSYSWLLENIASTSSFSSNLSSYNLSYSIDIISTATFSFRLTDIEAYFFTRFNMSPFALFSEIEFYETGRFPAQVTNASADRNYLHLYYKRFWGLIVDKSTSIPAGSKTISLTCKDMLYFLQLSELSIGVPNDDSLGAGIILLEDESGSTKEKDDWLTSHWQFTNMTVYDSIVFAIHRTFQYFIIPSKVVITNTERPADISSDPETFYKEWDKTRRNIMKYWSGRLSSILPAFRIFGLSDYNIDKSSTVGITGKDQFKAKATLDHNLLYFFTPKYSEYLKGEFSSGSSNTTAYTFIKECAESIGMEFFQDVDGSIILKPPFYNLNIFDYLPYTIELLDIVSIEFVENIEGIKSYVEISGSFDQIQEQSKSAYSFYINYNLAKQFGLRGTSKTVLWLSTKTACELYAINYLDIINLQSYSLIVQIIARPEIRIGVPVYIKHLDLIGYVTSIQRAATVGSNASMSLTLTALRFRLYNEKGQIVINAGLVTKGESGHLFSNSQQIDKDNENKAKNIKSNFVTAQQNYLRINGTEQVDDSFSVDPSIKSLEFINSRKAKSTDFWRFYSHLIEETDSDASKYVGKYYIPISDTRGFTHFGGFAYGRGIYLDKQGNLKYESAFSITSFELDIKDNKIKEKTISVNQDALIETANFKEVYERVEKQQQSQKQTSSEFSKQNFYGEIVNLGDPVK